MTIEIEKHYVFDYPTEFVGLPEYSAHRGQVVTVLRACIDGEEYDGPEIDPDAGELMFKIRAEDGWIGDAFKSELKGVEQ